jgi:DNA-binding SARP family transcriptional activator/predicted DCC family thiol-disulfide oxidoreductase YuxK
MVMKEGVMSCLALHLLGPPHIERDGVPIQVDTRKAIALLAYLAVTGESHRRASLANLLWPEYDRTRGRAALRRTLYSLRKALAGAWLEADQEEIGLNPSAELWVDVDQFHERLAACEAHGHSASQVCPACVVSLTQAVALVRGDFLAGFSLRDSFNFDDWQFFQADALRRELAGVLERLIRWHSAQREFDPAVAYAKRWLALDPLDEQVHNELMRLYAWSGQRSAALCQYEECLRILQDQLGVPPEEPTTQLYRAIKKGHAPPVPPAPPPPDFLARSPPFLEGEERAERSVFVARESELAQLARFLDSALAGKSKVVFVTGDAGCGKTALIQEFALRAQAAHPDLVIAWGHSNAHTGAGDPYLPFREVLSLLSGDVEAQWAAGAMTGEQARRLWHLLPLVARALVEVGPDLVNLFVSGTALVKRAAMLAPLGSDWLAPLQELVARQEAGPGHADLQQSALFEQYTQVLRALTNQRPLLLALDDLQWADAGSVNLLFHLGRRIGGSRILIVGAYRPAEVALGRQASPLPGRMEEPGGCQPIAWERHPLEPVVNEFKRTFGEVEVDLERAEGQQARGRQFVDAFLDSEPNRLGDLFRQTLYQHTRGTPLFTIELLRGMQERGELVHDREGRWVEGPALDWETLPVRVEAVIAERIGRLPARLRDLLTVASVEGETFTAEVVARVGAADEGEMIRSLSDILDRKYRLVSARGILQLDGRRLSRYRFRHILFQKYLCNRLDPVERAHLHEAVGTVLEALYGDRTEETAAIETGAAQLARHFEAAGVVEKAVDYLRQAGERAQGLYANEEAIRYFQRALLLLENTRPAEAQRRWQQEMAARLHERLGDMLEWTGEHEKAAAAYQGALGHIPEGDRIRQSQLHRKVGNVWRLQNQHERALQAYEWASIALGRGTAESPPEWWQEWVQIQLERMWLYYWLGQWSEMSELAKIRPSVEQHGTPSQCISFFLCLASMNNRRDRYVVSEETLTFCRIALAISQELEDVGEIAWARFVLGFSQLWHGDLDEAEKQMQAALELAEQTGDVVHQSRCLTYLTILYRKRGQLDQARGYAFRSLAAAKAGRMLEYIGTAQANLAWVAWREGDLARTESGGQAALKLWQQLPAGHASCAFQWTALWPLVAVAAAQDRLRDACELMCALLEPTQQRLLEALTAVIENAVSACEESKPEATRTWLDQAVLLAGELAYL